MDLGELRVIGELSTLMVGEVVKGELRLTWNKANSEEVATAERTFNKYIARGWIAISETAERKTQIFFFDPNFEKIVLAPLVMGG